MQFVDGNKQGSYWSIEHKLLYIILAYFDKMVDIDFINYMIIIKGGQYSECRKCKTRIYREEFSIRDN